MTTRTLTNRELQVSIRRDRSTTEYLEIQGIKRNNIKNLSRDVQKELDIVDWMFGINFLKLTESINL